MFVEVSVDEVFKFHLGNDDVQHGLQVIFLRLVKLGLGLAEFETGSKTFEEFYLVLILYALGQGKTSLLGL